MSENLSNKIVQHLNSYSRARNILLQDKIDEKFIKVYSSTIPGITVKSYPAYLLYKSIHDGNHVYITEKKDTKQLTRVLKRKYVPTLSVQRCCVKVRDEVAYSKFTAVFRQLEEDYIVKLVQMAYHVNENKCGDKNLIRCKSLKYGVSKANAMLKSRIKLVDALSKVDGTLKDRVFPNIKFNILSNVNFSSTDLKDDITVKGSKLGLNYNDNTFINSDQIPPNSLFVMPTGEHLGVMPIIKDIDIYDENHYCIASYEIGMSIINTDNIIRVDLEVDNG